MKEKLPLLLYKPQFEIGQKVYVPQREGPLETVVVAYEARIAKERGELVAGVAKYIVHDAAFVFREPDAELTSSLCVDELFTDPETAAKASVFYEVNADEETWRRAIGERDVEQSSPYSIYNADLQPCCSDISDARDLLMFARRHGGLLAYQRDSVAGALTTHDIRSKDRPLALILSQLDIRIS